MMLGAFGPVQLIILGVVVLLLFGHRLPGAMRALGESCREFRRGVQSAEDA